jgi:hypothetical protein
MVRSAQRWKPGVRLAVVRVGVREHCPSSLQGKAATNCVNGTLPSAPVRLKGTEAVAVATPGLKAATHRARLLASLDIGGRASRIRRA